MKYKRKWTILISVMILCIILCLFSREITSKDNGAKDIPVFHSTQDYDQDGIDDQTDILQGALDYVKTRPKYKSVYYNTGFPDDGYGVCTDVAAFAMLHAGYNLMELVEEDITANPESYDIDTPDKNIDFRRVRNLNIYFSHTASALTTDPSVIEEWQGGDIVVFRKHIGIVSNRRNKDGVCYVIHHDRPLQVSYEEDILQKRNDITAHYRISP